MCDFKEIGNAFIDNIGIFNQCSEGRNSVYFGICVSRDSNNMFETHGVPYVPVLTILDFPKVEIYENNMF